MDLMKSFILAPRWSRYCFIAGFVTGMFLLIWWMAREEEKEVTFLDVCWYGGQAHYLETEEAKADCPGGGAPLHWKKKTKTVRWDFGPDFDTYKRSHQKAIDWVNKELGFKALDTTFDDSADITIHQGSYEGSEGGAMATQHFKHDGTISAVIVVKHPVSIREWMLEEEHELLHALGLAHDRTGIMSKSLDEGEGMKIWLLHEKDRDALRDLLYAE